MKTRYQTQAKVYLVFDGSEGRRWEREEEACEGGG
jgi:hypothetical protein